MQEITNRMDIYLPKFREKSGDKYTYLTEFISKYSDLIKIQCDCGYIFYKTANEHLRYGCRKCGSLTSKLKRTMSQENI